MKRLLQNLAIWFYEKMGCREMDNTMFWATHIMHATPKGMDHKIIVTKMEELTGGPITYVGTYHSDTKTFRKEE